MVEQPFMLDQLLKNLDQAILKIEEISKEQSQDQQVSHHQLKDAIQILEACHDHLLVENFWEDKKITPEEMRKSLTKALAILQLFQQAQASKDESAHKSVQEMIASLFATLMQQLELLKQNLGDLKKHRIGQKVERTQPIKEV